MLDPDRIRRRRLVEELASRGIAQRAVLDAIGAVPRERFVDEALRGKADTDTALPIGDKQTISQPWVVARMCELAGPDPEGRVLEIGTGSGYHAAVLSKLFAQVYTVERLRTLSERARATLRDIGIQNVHFKIFDGTYGWSEFAPYEAILVTAGAPDVPEPLLDQLAPGGRLVLPVGPDERAQTLVRIVARGDGRFEREEHGLVRFVPLVGRFGWKE
jgi:protein-L-isoaspartate(D-aspartate) O-methyltransferase